MTPSTLRSWTRPGLGVAAVGAAIAVPLLVFGSSPATASQTRLERFAGCDDFVQAARARALAMIANGGGFAIPMAGAAEDTVGGRQKLQATAPNAATSASTTHSTTNTQEVGIDEPDIVKTDGARTFAVANGRLYAIDTSGTRARIASSLQLPQGVAPQEMLLSGNRLLVVGSPPMMIEPAVDYAPGVRGGKMPAQLSGTWFFDVDVSDMGRLSVRQTLKVDANYVSARMSGTTVRVVMGSDPMSQIGMNATDEKGLRAAIGRAGVDQFVPAMTLTDANGHATTSRMVGCTAISRPTKPSDLGLLTLLTMDLSQGIAPVDSDAIMAQGYTVMASAKRVYVALGRSDVSDRTMTAYTDIHAFDASSPNTTTYVGSGTVAGNLLNQYSMSEFDGRLRVATTLQSYRVDLPAEPPTVDGGGTSPSSGGEEPTVTGAVSSGSVGAPAVGADDTATSSDGSATAIEPTPIDKTVVSGGTPASESQVAILELRDDRLTQVGRVGGLGKGEQIYAVRFVGPTGYVVTFRQTDPLYTIDLSNPTAPRVAGALKIPGYSSYLHPVDDHTLIGVGQNADARGRVRGLQVGLFDVSNPAAPRRLQVWTLPGGGSEAEYDPHALLWWPATRTLVLPLMNMGYVVDSSGRPVQRSQQPAAVALRVTATGITRTGTIRLPRRELSQVRRTLVIGPQLYSVADGGVLTSSLDGAHPHQWLAFK